ncbi:hypothetical protein ACVGX7_07515, partial [Enterobacter hormaechei]
AERAEARPPAPPPPALAKKIKKTKILGFFSLFFVHSPCPGLPPKQPPQPTRQNDPLKTRHRPQHPFKPQTLKPPIYIKKKKTKKTKPHHLKKSFEPKI